MMYSTILLRPLRRFVSILRHSSISRASAFPRELAHFSSLCCTDFHGGGVAADMAGADWCAFLQAKHELEREEGYGRLYTIT